jgi:hypothetical protein
MFVGSYLPYVRWIPSNAISIRWILTTSFFDAVILITLSAMVPAYVRYAQKGSDIHIWRNLSVENMIVKISQIIFLLECAIKVLGMRLHNYLTHCALTLHPLCTHHPLTIPSLSTRYSSKRASAMGLFQEPLEHFRFRHTAARLAMASRAPDGKDFPFLPPRSAKAGRQRTGKL